MTAVAWDEPATRAALRRLRRRGLGLVCVGVDALLVLAALGVVGRSEPDLGTWLAVGAATACFPLLYGLTILLSDVPRIRRLLQSHPWLSMPGRVRVVRQGGGTWHAVDLGVGGGSSLRLRSVSLAPFESAGGALWFAGDPQHEGVVAVDRGGALRRCTYPRRRAAARALEAPVEQEEQERFDLSRAGRTGAVVGAVIGLALGAWWLRPWQVAEGNPDLTHVATRTALARVVGEGAHVKDAPTLQYVDFDGPHGPVRHAAVRVSEEFRTERESDGTFFVAYDVANPRRVTVPGDSDEPLSRAFATAWLTLFALAGCPLVGAGVVGTAVEAIAERRSTPTT